MMIADMVEELGHTVVAEAATIEEASALAKTSNFEIAILDARMDRAEPQTRRASRGSSYRGLCRNRYVEIA